MRLLINLIKLGLYAQLVVAALLLTGLVALTHYQGEVAGLELLGLESHPLGMDPLVGWLFEAVSPEAGFVHWTAAAVTGSITLLAWFVCHRAFAMARLLRDSNVYRQRGEGAELGREVCMELAMLTVALALLIPLLLGDAYIYQYRSLAGVGGIDDPLMAARSIPSLTNVPAGDQALGSVSFLLGRGWYMYVALGLAPAIGIELVGRLFFETLALISAQVGSWFAPSDEAAEPAETIFYGYDAEGEPVYDPDLPVTYDVNQQPVAANADQGGVVGDVAAHPVAEEPRPANDDDPAAAAARQDPLLPIVGRAGEEITMSEAATRPDEFHVERRPRRAVWDRKFWESLKRDGDLPESTPEKESA